MGCPPTRPPTRPPTARGRLDEAALRGRGLRGGVEEQRRVAHPTRDRPVHGEPVPAVQLLGVGRERDAVALRLDAEQTAEAGGDADRAEAVGAERGPHQAGGDGGTRTSRGAAGGVLEVPGVAGDAERRRLGERPQRQLGHVGLAEDHAPASRRRRTTSWSALAGRSAAPVPEGGDLAGDVGVVLDRDRHPQQRALSAGAPPRVGLVGFQQRAFGEHSLVGVQLLVVALDPVEVELHELARGDLPGGDQLCLAGDPGEGEVHCVHLPKASGSRLRGPFAAPRAVAGTSASGRGACANVSPQCLFTPG